MEKIFEINRDKVRQYDIVIAIAVLLIFSIFTLPFTLGTLFTRAWIVGLSYGIVWTIGLFATIGYILLTPLRTDALLYRLDSKTLKVNKGIIFKSRKSIPLEKITDVELVQGPLLWIFQMWILRIQTASTGQQTPEATLIGCVHPEQVRDDILAARDEYMKELAHR